MDKWLDHLLTVVLIGVTIGDIWVYRRLSKRLGALEEKIHRWFS